MAVKQYDAFNVLAAAAIDTRLVMSKAEMLAKVDANMPTDYLTVCSDDNKIYIYKKTNDVDPETGKFRLFSSIDRFTATFTINTETGACTCDKTIAEILAAVEKGSIVSGVVSSAGVNLTLSASAAKMIQFSGIVSNVLLTATIAINEEGSEECTFTQLALGNNGYPIDVATEAELEALVTEENIGRAYRFTGKSSTYNTNDLYVVEEE